MRFSFKKTLATILSIALILSSFVAAFSSSAAEASVVGALSLEDVSATLDDNNQFSAVANISLEQPSSYLHVAFTLADLPQGVSLVAVSADTLAATIVNLDNGIDAIYLEGDKAAVSNVAITFTFTADDDVDFTLAVNKIFAMDDSELDVNINVSDSAFVSVKKQQSGEPEEPVVFNGTFRIKTVSLILGGEILIKYTMGTDSGSLNDPVIKEYGILAWNEDVYDPDNIEYDPAYAIPCETEDHTFKIAKYSFEMTDVVYTRAYAILTDGTIIYGIKNGENQAPVEYSVLKYATTQLNKTGSSAPNAATKNLLIAMLNYGAAAQQEFIYKTDTLANASLTDAQKVITDATFDSDPQQGHIEDGKESVQDIANTRINGVSLVLSSAVLEKFYIRVSTETKAIKNVTLLTWLEEDYAKLTDGAVVGTETYSELCTLEADGRYSGKSMGLYAFELRDDVFARGYIEYEDGTFGYTKLFQTSAEYYAKQQIGKTSTGATTKKLLNAMMAYNDAAEVVFG